MWFSLAYLLPSVVLGFSQIKAVERLFITHLNMFRMNPTEYTALYNFSTDWETPASLPPLVFLDALYPSTSDYASALGRPSGCAEHECLLASRAHDFCPECLPSSLRELVGYNSTDLYQFQRRVLKTFANVVLDTAANAISLGVSEKNVVAVDMAYLSHATVPIFYGGAHLRTDSEKTHFWVNSLSVLHLSIVFYNETVEYLDEFIMRPLFLSTMGTSFYFGISGVTLENIRPVYYSFHANLNENDYYSDLFCV